METQSRPPAQRPAHEGAPAKKSGGRIAFLDWTRGMAATIMLQGHVFHSFMRNDLREGGPYVISQFIGGITPAIFLFLTGITLAFGIDGRERRGASKGDRVKIALKRAMYLGLLAFAFRFQLWLFGQPNSPWTDLLKVDILNCMAIGIVAVAWMAALTTAQRVHAGIVAGLAIASAAPLVSLIPPGSLPWVASLYLQPNPNYFAFFPWAAFLAFGVAAGSILRLVSRDHMNQVMQWSAILGFGLVISAQYASNLPYTLYPSVDYWLNSPALILVKLGVILIVLALAYLWTHHGAPRGWSWVQQLGTTSLLVYWVHIELVYGRWFWFWKEGLTALQCAAISVVLIALMVAMSWARTYWRWPDLRLGSIRPVVDHRR